MEQRQGRVSAGMNKYVPKVGIYAGILIVMSKTETNSYNLPMRGGEMAGERERGGKGNHTGYKVRYIHLHSVLKGFYRFLTSDSRGPPAYPISRGGECLPSVTLTGIRGREGNNKATERTSEEGIILRTNTGHTYFWCLEVDARWLVLGAHVR